MSFQRVSAASELWPGEMKGIVVDGVKVVLINAEGTIYAYADRCAHRGVPLSTGELRDGVLVCTVHYWEYDPCTGCGINPQGFQLVPYAVKVGNGDIWVDVQNRIEPGPCGSDDGGDDGEDDGGIDGGPSPA